MCQGIIQAEANMCVNWCGLREFADHLFLLCNYFGGPWHLISN